MSLKAFRCGDASGFLEQVLRCDGSVPPRILPAWLLAHLYIAGESVLRVSPDMFLLHKGLVSSPTKMRPADVEFFVRLQGNTGPVSQACSPVATQQAVRPTMSPSSTTLSNHREVTAVSPAFGNHTSAMSVPFAAAPPLPSNATTFQKSALLKPALGMVSKSSALNVSAQATVRPPQSSAKQQESDSDDDSPIRPKFIAKGKLLSDSEEEDRIPLKRTSGNATLSRLDAPPQSSPSKPPLPASAASSPVKMDGPHQKNRTPVSSSANRQDDSSESSTYSDSSSETSSSDRSDSSETSEDSGSSDSSEATTSESEDSEEERLDRKKPLKPKRPPSKPAQIPSKRAKLQVATRVRAPTDAGSRSKSQELSGDEEEGNLIKMGTFEPRNRSSKAKLVAQLLCRWWYVLPDWPPANFDYVTQLNERRLQLVPLEEYEDLDDVDERGFTKVYQISAFPASFTFDRPWTVDFSTFVLHACRDFTSLAKQRVLESGNDWEARFECWRSVRTLCWAGVFRDPQGRAIDLRPAEGRPCYSNLIKKSEHELMQLVEKAIRNQMESLKQSVYDERRTHKKLQLELSEVTKELERFRMREELLKRK